VFMYYTLYVIFIIIITNLNIIITYNAMLDVRIRLTILTQFVRSV